MSISIDPEQENRIRAAVQKSGSLSPEEFVRQALEFALLESMILEGLDSRERLVGTPEYWEQKRQRLADRHPGQR